MPFTDPEAARAAARRHYAANAEKVRAKARATKKNYDRTTKQAIKDYKENHPCSDCSESYPYYVMEFDHVPERGKKTIDISLALQRRWKFERILKEIEKCDVVCANCHRIRTFGTSSRTKVPKCRIAPKNSKS